MVSLLGGFDHPLPVDTETSTSNVAHFSILTTTLNNDLRFSDVLVWSSSSSTRHS